MRVRGGSLRPIDSVSNFTQQIFEGAGSLRELPSLVSGRVLIVTDGGIVKAGHVERAVSLLDEVVVFDEVRENPRESDVAACAEFARGDVGLSGAWERKGGDVAFCGDSDDGGDGE